MLRKTWSKLASFSVSCCSSHHHVFSNQAMGTILVSPATTKRVAWGNAGELRWQPVSCHLKSVTQKWSNAYDFRFNPKSLTTVDQCIHVTCTKKHVYNLFGHRSWCFRLKLCIFIAHIIILIYHLWLWEYTAISVGVLMENKCLTVIVAKHLFRKLVSTQW